jgi:methionyl-tRNA formyltransferase
MTDFPRIVFYGTPGFAVASLQQLIDNGYHVVAVVTASDKPSGRGLKERSSPVKEFAVSHGIPVLQPVNMKDTAFLDQLSAFSPDLQIVIAFRMMPRAVWSFPSLGTFNLHASLLPQYRGAAPINRAVMNGETETGVTTFMLNDQIDTGKIILSERVPIGKDETAGELHDRLMEIGAGLVARTVDMVAGGKLEVISQETLISDPVALKQAPKIFKDDCRINWDQEVTTVHDFIRGLSPHPGAFTDVKMADGSSQNLKIYRTLPEHTAGHGLTGHFITDGKSYLKVGVKNGFIHIQELQLAGRKVMSCGDFLRGFGKIFAETRAI